MIYIVAAAAKSEGVLSTFKQLASVSRCLRAPEASCERIIFYVLADGIFFLNIRKDFKIFGFLSKLVTNRHTLKCQ